MAGRKKIPIDKELFEKLCAIQCTLKEISAVLRVSEDTVERFCKQEYKCTFKEAYETLRQPGLASLRRSQFKLAQKSASMAIFLGKNYLGQTDERQVKAALSNQIETIAAEVGEILDED